MIEAIIFLFILGIVWDNRIIKKQNKFLYEKIFYVPLNITVPLAIIVLAVIVFSQQRWDHLSYLILLIVFPLYLYKRHLFLDALGREGSALDDARPHFALKSGAFGVVIIWFFSVLILSVLLNEGQKLFPQLSSDITDLIITAAFSSAVLFYLIHHAAQRFSNQGFFANVALVRNQQPLWKIILVPVGVGLVFSVISASLLLARKVQPSTPLSETLMATESSFAIFIFLVMALFVAPLFEEIVFRGYFFHVVEKIKGQMFAVISIALVFALLHVGQYWGDWLAILMVALMGFALTILRAWTGSTIASAIAHYVYNGGVMIIPVVALVLSNPAYFDYQAHYHSYDTQTKIELLKESIHKQPEFAEAYNDLAWLYAQENINLEEAFSFIEKALVYDPENTAFGDTKAEVLTQLGRHDEAMNVRRDLINRNLSGDMRKWQLEKIEELKSLQLQD